ncbi:MAG: Rad52/Rad22 family DNA repair protein [Alistipes sp.]
MCNIRLLRADEIEVRVQQCTAKGAILLLYKNARADMSVLDETFGMYGWQRTHAFLDGRNYCRVSIYDKETKQWIVKEDTGVESNADAQKGEASDAFKRACVNVGIGRELYTSPFIWVSLSGDETTEKNGKFYLKSSVKISVKTIGYDEQRAINQLSIVDHNGKIRYELGKRVPAPTPPVPDPIVTATPASPASKKPLLMEHLADDAMCDQVMQWVYNAHALCVDKSNFNPSHWICERRTVSAEVLVIFKEKYEMYCLKKLKK